VVLGPADRVRVFERPVLSTRSTSRRIWRLREARSPLAAHFRTVIGPLESGRAALRLARMRRVNTRD
jgi:hypothetical protein